MLRAGFLGEGAFMEGESPRDRLSQISTLWSMLRQAHGEPSEKATAVRREVLSRYGGAVYRYLLGALRDEEAANDLAQEFALRFLRGDFHRADAQRGRFRDYLKTALSHLITDHYRQRQNWPQALSPGAPELADARTEPLGSDADFLASWRAELLDGTWRALARANPAYHAVLRLRIEQPDMSSAQMAEHLTAELGQPHNAAWVRQTLRRAHDKYADLLLDEVVQSLPVDTVEALRQELHELDVLKYCQAALEKRGR
jgi:RNA polymerase sigma-70 factor (ECF subfamily)